MCMNTKDEAVPSNNSQGLRLPGDIKPRDYNLEILLKESTSEFTGHVVITADVLKSTDRISLHAKNLNITEVKVSKIDGKGKSEDIPVAEDTIEKVNGNSNPNSIITINTKERMGAETKIAIDIFYNANVSDDMAGFYKSDATEGEDAAGYIYSTQFEATSARLAFPCWDEPEFKATFNISIVAPTKYTVLSNSSLKNSTAHSEYIKNNASYDDNVLYTAHTFKPTPVMSTYLVAWVIGELDFVEEERIKVYTPKGQKETGKFSLDVAVRCLKYFDEYFGIEYQMDKLDMVAIPNFSAGAMENWGLVTYRSSSLLYREGSTTEMQKLYIAETVCHELAHQWFGNLVTMKWWNDLWLNEGFATWAGTLATAVMAKDINLMYNPWEEFLESDISRGMQMDGKLSTHPINVRVESSGEISSIFDAISYSKGASMIQMLSKYVGENKFKEGLQKYIKKHKYGNTETKDLWKELDSADGKITESMTNWIDTAGYPKISVEIEDSSLVLTQTRYLPSKDAAETESERDEKWMIFLTKKRFTSDGGAHEESILFPGKEMRLNLDKGHILFNVDATGFYLVEYSDDVLNWHIIPLLQSDKLSQFERYGIFRDIISLATDGHRSATYALNMMQYVKSDERAFVVGLVAGYLTMLSKRYIDDKEIYLAVSTELSNLLQKYLDGVNSFTTVPDDGEVRKLRIIAVGALAQIKDSPIQKEICRLAEANELSKVHKDYKASMYASYAKYGGKKAYDYLYEIIKSKTANENEKLFAISAISHSQDEVDAVFKLFAERNPYIKNQDKMRMVLGLAQQKEQRKTFRMFAESFADIVKIFDTTRDNVARFVEVFIASQRKRENIEEVMQFFKKKENVQDAWVSAIKKGSDIAEILNRFYEENKQGMIEWSATKTVEE
ncbi:hypothetical protein NEMIN01_1792 [Nematocida minor]|uniref:uncharacterized protein n=1 Tax=Nematocida minor TaxID=1912983 RepID=UPI00221ED632|nr:uncharacterized protein NEMIN01_1792 [Nematocida minor]KAI5192044.1 hypothetical protein NEMIN01_1792 [Nematocida minor]